MTMKLPTAVLMVVIGVGFLGPAQAADLLILKSSAASLPEGGFIDGARQLSLPAGTTVTLLDEAGKKITLTGPYAGVPAAPERTAESGGFGGRMLMALSRLIVGAPRDPSRLGATRGALSAPPSDVWLINVSISGDHCLRRDPRPALWRSRSTASEALLLKRYRSKQSIKSEWPAGAATFDWPDNIDLVDNATYLVRLGTGIAVSKIIVHLVPGKLPTDYHRAAWMVEKGCLRQARRILTEID